jgi:alpha-glucoside transport system substrate-binding protein
MQFSQRGKKVTVALAAAALSMTGMAACGGGSGSTNSKTVTLWTSVDDPIVAGWKQQLVPEAKKQGITLNIKKVNNINQIIMTKIQGGGAPDIATIPQPGVVADIVKRNAAQPLDSVLDMNALKSSIVPGAIEAGTVNGKYYGLLVSMNVKSLVFYPKKAWADAGYTAPDSIDAMNALADKMRSNGDTPWCMGIGSDAATGWPATDWFEDLVMRYGGAQQYNDWVSHKIKFDSPLVKQAAAEFEKVAFTSGNVPGGRKSISSTAFGDAGTPMFAKPKPGCWMLKQGSFITTFFPKDVQADLDANVGVYGFPPATAGGENPTLGGGDLAVLLSKNTNAQKVLKLMATKDFGTDAVKETGSTYLSPHKDFDTSLYPNAFTKAVADVAYTSSVLLFDGSDSMPGAVGAGAFWKDITAWVSGQESLDTALKNIDAAWPAS